MHETCREESVNCCIGSGIVARTGSRLSERLMTHTEEPARIEMKLGVPCESLKFFGS